jgi:hypothetical protein
MRPTASLLAALDRVERVVCARQHPVSGLLPASTAVTTAPSTTRPHRFFDTEEAGGRESFIGDPLGARVRDD